MKSIQLCENTPAEELKHVKGVIFDCDGVLINSLKSNRWYYNWFKNKFGLAPLTEDEEKYILAHTVFESLEHILPEEYHKEAIEMRSLPELEEALSYIEIEEDLKDLLIWLRDNGIKMGINTNRTDSLQTVLQNLGIESFFNPAVTSKMLPNAKPHPDGVLYILKEWGFDKEDVAYIGDTWVDETCAKSADVEFWAYRSKGLTAAMHIDSYKTLRNVLDKAAKSVWK